LSEFALDFEDEVEEDIQCFKCEELFPPNKITPYRRKNYCADCLDEIKEVEKEKKKIAKQRVVPKPTPIPDDSLMKKQMKLQAEQTKAIQKLTEKVENISKTDVNVEEISILTNKIKELEEIIKKQVTKSELSDTSILPPLDSKIDISKSESSGNMEIIELQNDFIQDNLHLPDQELADKLSEMYKQTKIYRAVMKQTQNFNFKVPGALFFVIELAIKDMASITTQFSPEVFSSWLEEYGLSEWRVVFKSNLIKHYSKTKAKEMLIELVKNMGLEDRMKIHLIIGKNQFGGGNSTLLIRTLFRLKHAKFNDIRRYLIKYKVFFGLNDLSGKQIKRKITSGVQNLRAGDITTKDKDGWALV